MNISYSEAFRSFQGEGPYLGRPCVFFRTAGCNLACKWCDSAYTWNFGTGAGKFNKADEVHTATVTEIFDIVKSLRRRGDGIVLTGGEPVLQAQALSELMSVCLMKGAPWSWASIETAGTFPLPEELEGWLDLIVVSPKLPSSGNDVLKAIKWPVLREFSRTTKAVFKFVATSPSDLADIQTICDEIDANPSKVWLMPEGVDAAHLTESLKWLAPIALDRGWNLTTRLHIYAFGNRRGV